MIYLPYPDFTESVEVLDKDTLLEQAMEICQLMENFHETPWATPQSQEEDSKLRDAWYGYEPQLCELGLECIQEYLVKTGEKRSDIEERLQWHLDCATSGKYSMEKPFWVGDPEIHAAHQAELVRLNPEFYKDLFEVEVSKPMVWPT